jgi:hypothetical protein
MSQAARSIYGYAIYLFGQGATLLLVPGLALSLFGLEPPVGIWVRVTGMTILFFGIYYVVAARTEWRAFFVTTVFTRLAVPFVFLAFIAAGLAPWNLLLFTPLDILFSLWTIWALRQDMRVVRPSMA